MNPYAFALILSLTTSGAIAGAVAAQFNPAGHTLRDRLILAALGGAAGLIAGGMVSTLVYMIGRVFNLIGG